MNGLVLAGGKSSRMGSPKAEIAYHGVPEFIRCADLLSSVCAQVLLSTSEFWTPKAIPNAVLMLPDPKGASAGPLTGIAHALKVFPDSPLVVLACDMPLFDQHALSELLAQRDDAFQATCFALDGTTPEPLCAIYEPSSAGAIFDALDKDIRCARRVLDKMKAKRVKPTQTDWVRNINDKDEYESFVSQGPSVHIDVVFVAQLREFAGKSNERVSTHRKTPHALFEDLRARYGFSLRPQYMRVAVNDELVPWTHALKDNDRVMFVPPVAGG